MNPGSASSRVAIIMAAGMGTRMGGPKALLRWLDERPLALSHATARMRDCARVVIVTRRPIAACLGPVPPGVQVVVSDAEDCLGPAGSIGADVQAGALTNVDVVLLSPVDLPPTSGATVETLFRALGPNVDAVRPRHGTRRGHPVICRGSLVREAYGAVLAPPLRDLLSSLGHRCADVPVDDTDVIMDLDTPEIYFAKTGRSPDFWQ